MKRLLLGMAMGLVAGTVPAQPVFPTKPVTVVVAFPAGGPTDIIARTIAASMQKTLGQQVPVENVSGAGGTVGVGRVARAQPDGYTLVLHHIGMATAPALFRKLAYDPLQDFVPLGSIADVPMTIVARGDFPAKNWQELVSHIRTGGDKLTYANAGIGSASHLCGLVFMQALQVQMTTVPYKGTQPAMTDLLGGRVDLLCDQTSQTTAQIRANKIRAYAVTTRERVGTLPDLPTLHELGLRDFNISIWHVLYTPRGTPSDVVERLVKALQTALADPAVKQRFNELGTDPQPAERATPENARAMLRSEIDRWTPIIRKAGQYAD